MTNTNTTAIRIPTTESLEEICWALAEGEHDLGDDATDAGYALIMWPDAECPWGRPRHFAA